MKWGGVILCLGLVACASPPTSYYRLKTAYTVPPVRAVRAPILQVGPVAVPAWLNRAELVRIDSSGQVILLANAQWAAPLSQLLALAVAQAIEPELDWCQVRAWPSASPYAADWLMTLDVSTLAADTQRLNMVVSWQVLNQGRRVKGGTLSHVVPLNGESVEALVAAYSQATAILANTIAISLRTMPSED